MSDHDAQAARLEFHAETGQIIELAAACNIAALKKGLIPGIEGKNVVILICGGNDTAEDMAKNFTPFSIPEAFQSGALEG